MWSSYFALCPCVLSQTLCDPMDYSPTGSSVHGILQARILEWVAMPSFRDLPYPGIKPHLLCPLHWQVGSLPIAPPGKSILPYVGKEQINKMLPVRLSCPTLSRPQAPCSVNSDFAGLCNGWDHIALHMHFTRYSLGLGLLCVLCLLWTSPWKPWLLLHQGYIGATHGYVICGSVMATLWLCYGCCYGCLSPACFISQEGGCVTAAVPARRK